MTEFSERVLSLARKSRAWRLAGDHHHGRDTEFPLVGYCFDNAYVAWHVFDTADIEARVIEGTTERVADDLIVEGLDPREFNNVTELAGLVHYWLEVDAATGETMYVDIASDSFETLGECLVTSELPADYIELPDSREAGRETFENVRSEDVRCQYCGDQKYDYGGCPACHDTLSADLQEEAN